MVFSRNGIMIPGDVFEITEAALKAATVEPEWLDLLLVTTKEISDVLSNKNEGQQSKGSLQREKSPKRKKQKN